MMDSNGQIAHEGTFFEIHATVAGKFDSALDIDAAPQSEALNHTKPELTPMGQNTESPTVTTSTLNTEAELSRQTGDSDVYKFYAKSARLVNSCIFVSSMAVFAFCDAFPSMLPSFIWTLGAGINLHLGLWLKWWGESNARHPNSDLGKWLGVYAALGVGGVASCLLGAW